MMLTWNPMTIVKSLGDYVHNRIPVIEVLLPTVWEVIRYLGTR